LLRCTPRGPKKVELFGVGLRAAAKRRTVQTGVSCFREECALTGSPLRLRDGVAGAGEETLGSTVAARGKRRSRPLPTKATREAVDGRGFRASGARKFGEPVARVHMTAPWIRADLTRWECRTGRLLCRRRSTTPNAPAHRVPVNRAKRAGLPDTAEEVRDCLGRQEGQRRADQHRPVQG
jgi:hypothetical protein